tara:strand:+ start:6732 stop:7310 length:579 start_codon:yes stop_codon:yes gene_type:complete
MYKKLATLAICTLCSPIVANTTNLDASQDVAAAFHLATELPLTVGGESITYSTDSFSRPSPLLKKLTLNQNGELLFPVTTQDLEKIAISAASIPNSEKVTIANGNKVLAKYLKQEINDELNRRMKIQQPRTLIKEIQSLLFLDRQGKIQGDRQAALAYINQLDGDTKIKLTSNDKKKSYTYTADKLYKMFNR